LREYVAWPTSLLYPVPASFDDATIALLEPLGVALHTFDLGHTRFGGSVAVVGCGPIGLMVSQVARAAGVRTVLAVEPLPHRRQAAAQCGADVVLSSEEAAGVANEVDVVFEVAGTDAAVATAMALVRPGGNVVLGGIPDNDSTTFPASVARRKGLTIRMARRMKDAYPRAVNLVERRMVELGPLVSATFPLDHGPEALQVAARREGLKVVVAVSS
jgi:L-iditol 2-dehydrogenase